MGARQKLNSIYLGVAAVVAAVAGLIFKSIAVFVVCFGGLMAAFLHDGSLRPKAVKHRRAGKNRR